MDTSIQFSSVDSLVPNKSNDDHQKSITKKMQTRENTLLKTIMNMTSKIQDKECEISRLKREMKTTVEIFEFNNQLLSKNVRELEESILDESRETKDLSLENEKLHLLITDQEQKLLKKDIELDDLKAEIGDLLKQLKKNKSKLEASEKENEDLMKQLKKNKNKLQAVEEEYQSLKESILHQEMVARQDRKVLTPVSRVRKVSKISPMTRSTSNEIPSTPTRMLTRAGTVSRINSSPQKETRSKKAASVVNTGSLDSPKRQGKSARSVTNPTSSGPFSNFMSTIRGKPKPSKQ